MTFAMITPALIIGAFAERMKFSAVLLFITALGDGHLLPDRALGLGRRPIPTRSSTPRPNSPPRRRMKPKKLAQDKIDAIDARSAGSPAASRPG